MLDLLRNNCPGVGVYIFGQRHNRGYIERRRLFSEFLIVKVITELVINECLIVIMSVSRPEYNELMNFVLDATHVRGASDTKMYGRIVYVSQNTS